MPYNIIYFDFWKYYEKTSYKDIDEELRFHLIHLNLLLSVDLILFQIYRAYQKINSPSLKQKVNI